MFELRWLETKDNEKILQYRTKSLTTLYPFYGVDGGAIEGRYDLVYTEWKDVSIVQELYKEYD